MTHEEYLRDKLARNEARQREIPIEARVLGQVYNQEMNKLVAEATELHQQLLGEGSGESNGEDTSDEGPGSGEVVDAPRKGVVPMLNREQRRHVIPK